MSTVSLTNEAYAGTPMWHLSESARGLSIESIVRRWVESTGQETSNPEPGMCINGTKRGQKQALCDFMEGDRRIEVKSSRMYWNCEWRRWEAHWQSIKRHLHDGLYLALYTPDGINVYLHDGTFGLSVKGYGENVKGDAIYVYGPKRTPSTETALDAICAKMHPMICAHISWSELQEQFSLIFSTGL